MFSKHVPCPNMILHTNPFLIFFSLSVPPHSCMNFGIFNPTIEKKNLSKLCYIVTAGVTLKAKSRYLFSQKVASQMFDWVRMSSWGWHCVKSVRIRSFYDPQFPSFGLNTDQINNKYGHFSRSAVVCHFFH